MPAPYTIGITGGSGSGKTYFIKALSGTFKPDEVCLDFAGSLLQTPRYTTNR